MSDLDTRAAAAALQPVREALLAAAHAEAERTVRAAQEAADHALAEASDRARALVEQGRREGGADADAALTSERSRTHRRARGLVLAAQRAAYDALRAGVQQQVAALPQDPAWPDMREQLAVRARQLLGADAELADVPGGVVARAGSRTVELTVSSLADAELVELGPEVEKLWVP
jgi:vacuolar-type H+-ATPase subunit E/Vma4